MRRWPCFPSFSSPPVLLSCSHPSYFFSRRLTSEVQLSHRRCCAALLAPGGPGRPWPRAWLTALAWPVPKPALPALTLPVAPELPGLFLWCRCCLLPGTRLCLWRRCCRLPGARLCRLPALVCVGLPTHLALLAGRRRPAAALQPERRLSLSCCCPAAGGLHLPDDGGGEVLSWWVAHAEGP